MFVVGEEVVIQNDGSYDPVAMVTDKCNLSPHSSVLQKMLNSWKNELTN